MEHNVKSIDPATGNLIAEYPYDTPERVQKALKAAVKAQAAWRKQPVKERAALLKQIAATLRDRTSELAELATREMGKPLQQSKEEIGKCAKAMDFYAKEGAGFLKDMMVETDARKSFVSFRPMGVLLAIMPWNFPFWQAFRAMAPAIMAGNAVLLKHSSNVTGCALAIERVMQRAGAPKGLFATLVLPSDRIEELIAAPEINCVTFTGSTAAGRKVAEAAGRNLKKQVLELGGSDAYVILEDADLDLAVKTLVGGRLVNSGQSCVAAKRFVPVKAVSEAFTKKVVAAMEQSTFGNPLEGEFTIGPMARIDLRDALHEQVRKSIEKGAKLLCGGYIPEQPGAYYPPTVLSRVKPGMPAYDEELFGPVAAIIEAKDTAAALKIANDSEYGLGGGIFSKDRKRAAVLASEEMESGSCFVNAFVHSDPRLPFGGVKNSGYGRELGGAFGIREFVNIKTVFVQ